MKKFLLGVIVALILFPAIVASADDAATPPTTTATGTTTTPATTTVMPNIPRSDFLPGGETGVDGGDFQDYLLLTGIPRVINIAIGILGIAAFIGILISAITMLTAYGSDDKLGRAKTALKYSLLGFFIVIFSYAIVSIVVSISLPKEEDADPDTNTGTSFMEQFVPTAYAVAADDINILLPSEHDMIENHDDQNRVSLPSGNILEEMLPALITNIMYLVAFLIFIAFVYGGTLMVIGRGNEEEVKKAKNIVIYAGIALAMISLGYAIIYGIATLKLTQDSGSTADDVFTENTDTGL
jgi:hypothetical protein